MPFPAALPLLKSPMRRFLLCTLLACPAFAVAQAPAMPPVAPSKPAAVPMATYTDPSGELSFEYPIVWKADTSAKFYLSPHILQGVAAGTGHLLPAGNY